MHNTYSVAELSEIFDLKYSTLARNLVRAKLQRYPRTSRTGKFNVYEVGEALFGFDKSETDEYVKEWRNKQHE